MARRELVSRDVRRMSLGIEPLEYVLVRRRGRRGVGLKVDENGLTVSAPCTMPLARIEALVRESERWVLRKVVEWRARQVPVVTWTGGTSLPLLDATLMLRVTHGSRTTAQRVDGELRVTVREPAEPEVRRAVISWYKRAAREHLGRRLTELAAAARLEAPRFFLSSALARWGSCNSRREIRLAWRLLKAPSELVDYVICHELAHLRHMNHSAAFWDEVQRQCPDYRRLRAKLFATDHLYRAF